MGYLPEEEKSMQTLVPSMIVAAFLALAYTPTDAAAQ